MSQTPNTQAKSRKASIRLPAARTATARIMTTVAASRAISIVAIPGGIGARGKPNPPG